MLDIDPPTRPGDQRFLRYANAVTQAEIRRLSSEATAHREPGGPVGAVRRELRRLAGSRSRTTPGRAKRG